MNSEYQTLPSRPSYLYNLLLNKLECYLLNTPSAFQSSFFKISGHLKTKRPLPMVYMGFLVLHCQFFKKFKICERFNEVFLMYLPFVPSTKACASVLYESKAYFLVA